MQGFHIGYSFGIAYSLRSLLIVALLAFSNSALCLESPAHVVGEVLQPGIPANHYFDITSADGEKIYAATHGISLPSARIFLYDSNNNLIAGGANINQILFETLPQGTDYRLSVTNRWNNRVGTYDLHFLKVPGNTEYDIVGNSYSTTGALTAADVESFSFEAAQGNDVNITSTIDIGDIVLSVFDPDGTRIHHNIEGGSGYGVITSLPKTGRYLIAIHNDNPMNSGTYQLNFSSNFVPASAGEVQVPFLPFYFQLVFAACLAIFGMRGLSRRN